MRPHPRHPLPQPTHAAALPHRGRPACAATGRPANGRPAEGRAGRGRAAFTLLELLLALTIVGVLMALGASGARTLASRQGAEQAGQALVREVVVARTFAMRAGEPVALVADRSKRQFTTRNAAGTVYRTLAFATDDALDASSVATNLAGDSVAFSARGLCLNCAASGASTLTVVSRGRSYSVTVNPLGRIRLVRPAAG